MEAPQVIARNLNQEMADIEETDQSHTLYNILRILLANPCLILMLGGWRSGKTDTSLLLMYLAKKWGLIDKIGSNIYTYDNPQVDYLNSFGLLKRWIHKDRSTKIFGFDEALQHLPSKRAMSKKSVQITSGLVPELSKGHCRIIFIAQTDKIAGDLLDSTFLRAVFQKNPYDLQNLRMGRKTMRCSSDLFKTVDLTGLPRSPIRFDKDRLAEFFEVEQIAFSELSEEWKVGKARIENRSYTWIKRELGIHPETAKRHVRKLLKAYLEGQTFKVVNK